MSRPHRHGLNVAPISTPIPIGSYVRRLRDRSVVNYLTSHQEMLISWRAWASVLSPLIKMPDAGS